MSSSSSTELAGFRLERELGRGTGSVVYEATQLSLHRRVAVKVVEADGAPALRWPEHPHVVSLYAAGPCEDGWFVAMQLIRGTSLATLLDTRRPRADVLARQLRDVGAALDAAHREGIAHGAVGARNVLVDADARAFLTDFQLRPGLASPESDRADFAALVKQCLGTAPVDPLPATAQAMVPAVRPRRDRRPWAAVGATVAALGAAAAILAWPGDGPVAVSPLLGGAAALGSPLTGGGVHTVDCSGAGPSGASEPCVLVQTHLDGRPVTALESGVVRRWTVRGAHGQLALTVLRRRGGKTAVVARSRYATIHDGGLHTLRANLPVRAGDLVGLSLAPEAGVGVRDSDGATLRRRFGTTDVGLGPFASGEQARELMLRAEYLPGARWKPVGVLSGPAAARAPDGRPIQVLELQGALSVVAVDAGGGRIAADLFSGARRVARMFVPGSKPAGRLASLYTLRTDGAKATVRLVWSNPLGSVSRDFTVGPRALVPLD